MAWQSKIVGHGKEAPDQLLASPFNWRIHPAIQQQTLEAAIEKVGYIRSVTVNQVTGHIIDGHLRVVLALRSGEPEIDVEYVNLTPHEELLALATIDPIAELAVTDAPKFAENLHNINTDSPVLQQFLSGLSDKAGLFQDGSPLSDKETTEQGTATENEPYSRKIEPPIYEPVNVKPDVSQLFDDTKTQDLVRSIQSAEGLTDEERRFLIIAAQRHTVLHFNKIADYYAHADKELQSLMEDSALVIIDFDKAIELGFVRLTERIAEQFKDEYGKR